MSALLPIGIIYVELLPFTLSPSFLLCHFSLFALGHSCVARPPMKEQANKRNSETAHSLLRSYRIETTVDTLVHSYS
jgi:hypothetical protein